MKNLSIQEQNVVCGGGVASTIGAAGGAAVASGGGSPGCSALGVVAGGLVGGSTGTAAFVGSIVSSTVTDACNNRPRNTGNSPGPIRQPAGANRYWPIPKGGQHRPGRLTMELRSD